MQHKTLKSKNQPVMYRIFLLFIVSSLLFISCKKGNNLVGNWEFVSGSHHSSDNYHSYILFSDNGHFLFTKNSLSDTLGNSISFGKWKERKDDSVIILNFDYPKSKMILKNVSNDGRNLGFINENSEEFYYKKVITAKFQNRITTSLPAN